MSDLTKDLRAAGFGSVLDAIEGAEAKVKALTTAGGLTAENAAEAAEAVGAAATVAGTAVSTVSANPVGEGLILAADAANIIVPLIQAAVTKKASTTGTVSASDVASLITMFQGFISKL